MSFDQPSLFEEKVEDLTGEQIIRAVWDGINPWTGEQDDALQDGLHDDFYYSYRDTATPIGTFKEINRWNNGDGREMGIVVLHKETGKIFLSTGTYSSWDGSQYDEIFEAEPYEFTETRYRKKS